MNPFGTGATQSPYDKRTWQHEAVMAAPLPAEGGIIYQPQDIEHQHKVGICTAISLVQNVEKVIGRKFSPDFHYLLQKKYVDQNWYEGSSILSSLKVGKNYGFLPADLSPITEQDRFLPYEQYAAKLEAIPDTEIQRLLTLCVNKLAGYAQLTTDVASLQKGITDSKAGILCMYRVGNEWWTPSWNTADIDPIRPPQVVISGHAIGQTYYTPTLFTVANTWGTDWNDKGNGHTNPHNYNCLEAWIPYYDALPPFTFKSNLWFGITSGDVMKLQIRLGVTPTGFFGFKTLAAVIQYQKAHTIPATGFVGSLTRASLNSVYGQLS